MFSSIGEVGASIGVRELLVLILGGEVSKLVKLVGIRDDIIVGRLETGIEELVLGLGESVGQSGSWDDVRCGVEGCRGGEGVWIGNGKAF